MENTATQSNMPSEPPINQSENDNQKRYKINIGESFSVGWNVFKDNFGLFTIIVLIILILSIPNTIINLLYPDPSSAPIPLGLMSINFLFSILSFVISMGLINISLKLYDKKETSLKDLFINLDKFLPILGAYFVVDFIVMGGMLLFIVPGIIATISLFSVFYLIIDKNYRILQAIRTSWAITKGYRLKIFLIAFISSILTIIAYIPIGMGLIVVIPTVIVAFIHIYRNLLSQAKKDGKLPVEKLQIWPKVFLWIGILFISIVIFTGIFFILTKSARQHTRELNQQKIQQHQQQPSKTAMTQEK